MSKFTLYIRHAFALIRADKLYSAIYIAGTAVAIASAMVIAIVFNMMLADIPPESNRSRTLYPNGYFSRAKEVGGEHYGFSTIAIDSCFRRMTCVEAVAGIIPAMMNRFDLNSNGQSTTISAIATDHDFFRIYDLTFLDGRPFSEKEFRNGERVCVVTDKVAAKINGSTADINGQPFHVIGVVKAVSAFMEDATADVYMPYTVENMGFYPDNQRPWETGDDYVPVSYSGNLYVRILLREGFTLKDFTAELEPIRKQYSAVVSSQQGEKIEWVVFARTIFFQKINFFRPDNAEDQNLALEAMNLIPPAILMLLFLFLPAINLSGLVSNRMEARRAEMGIRKAFGAKRRMLLREVISENLVLTLCGGVVGWGLSTIFIAAIRDNDIFLQMFVSSDQTVVDTSLQYQMFFTPTLFLIVFLCCLLLNLMAALIPAWVSLRKPIVESLNQKR